MGGLISPEKASGRVIKMWREGDVEVLITPALKDEYLTIFNRMRFGDPADVAWREALLHSLLGRKNCKLVNPTMYFDAVPDDPADNRLLECAVAGGADYIITQDHHLLKLKQFEGVTILKAGEFLEQMQRPN